MCDDFYGDIGCCLTCRGSGYDLVSGYYYDEHDERCICYDCKCRRCIWYETDGVEGWCRLAKRGLINIVINWKSGMITVKILYAPKNKFDEIIKMLKGHRFVFSSDTRTWFKKIDNNIDFTEHVCREIREISYLKLRVYGEKPRIKQITVDDNDKTL